MEKLRGTFVTVSHFVVSGTCVSIIVVAVFKYAYVNSYCILTHIHSLPVLVYQ